MADGTNAPNGGGLPADMPEAWSDKLMQQINVAIGARLAQVEKKRATENESLKGEIKKLLEEGLASRPPSAPEDPDAGVGGKKDRKGDAELNTLRKQIEELRAQNEAAQARASAERAKNRDASMRSMVSEALAGFGVDALRAKAAIALFRQDGRLEFEDDDSDRPLFRADSGELVALADGLKAWSKTEEAKVFLPPTGAKGSGSRPSSGGASPTGGKRTEAEIRQALGEALERVL